MEHNTSKENRGKVHPVPDVEDKKPIIGIVSDCLSLSVRKKPDPNGDLLMVIPAFTEVAIDRKASTDNFYRICTAAGIEGFCMKKYITVRE